MTLAAAQKWRDAPNKKIIFLGMSGLGKTYISNILRNSGHWYHYSIDYRIGTRYLGEAIEDNLKSIAMQNPFLREQFLSDSIYIRSNITFENLSPVSYYLGKPGAIEKGGILIEEFKKRQAQFKAAEISALLDTPHFIERAQSLYGYQHFVCDTGGSICEWVDPNDPNDPILKVLSKSALLVWIKGSDTHTKELIKRFDRAPKPMAYQEEFLAKTWQKYLVASQQSESDVDPDEFVRFAYSKALAHRQPRYDAIAQNWGVTIEAETLANAKTPDEIINAITHSFS